MQENKEQRGFLTPLFMLYVHFSTGSLKFDIVRKVFKQAPV